VTAVQIPGRTRPVPLWLIVAFGGAITSIALGIRSTFGLYVDPVIETLDTGRETFGLMVAVQSLVWGFSQPIAGAISDRWGAGRTLAAGGVLYVLALVLMAQSTSSGMIILSGGVLSGLAVGAASFAVVLSSVGRMVSAERRSVVLGSVSALGSLGQFAMIPLGRLLLDRTTWQNTVLVMAAVAATLMVFTPMFRGRASDYPSTNHMDTSATRTLRQELGRASRVPSYWLLCGGFLVCGFHVTFIGTYLVSYTQDARFDVSLSTASWALALIGLFNVVGSFSAGLLGQRFSYTKLLAIIYGMRAVFIAAYVVIPISGTTTIIFGATIGLLWLATVPLTSAIVTQQFGTTHSGALFGLVFLFHQFGSFFGAWLGGRFADATGSYVVVWWVAVALGIVAMIFHLMLDERPVPDQDVPGAGAVRLAPAAVALVVAVASVTAAVAPTSAAEASAQDSETALYCSLS